jgi:hypothetical protein
VIERWRHDYNHVRPHSVHGGLTPDAVPLNPAAGRLRNLISLRRPAATSRTCSSCAGVLGHIRSHNGPEFIAKAGDGLGLCCTPHRRIRPNRPLPPASSALLCSCSRRRSRISSRSRLLPRSPVRMGGSDGIVDRHRDPVFDPAEGRPFQYPL